MCSASAYRQYVTRYYQYVTYFQRFLRAACTKGGHEPPMTPPKSSPGVCSQNSGLATTFPVSILNTLLESLALKS